MGPLSAIMGQWYPLDTFMVGTCTLPAASFILQATEHHVGEAVTDLCRSTTMDAQRRCLGCLPKLLCPNL